MRWWIVLVLLASSTVPSAQAQQASNGLTLVDAIGDVVGPVPAAGAGFVDLDTIAIQIDEAGLDVRVTVASLQTDGLAQLRWELWVALEYANERFDVLMEPSSTSAPLPEQVDRVLFGDVRASLVRMADLNRIAMLSSMQDPATRTFNATLPWSALVAANGASPSPGEPIRILAAGSAWTPLVLGAPHNPFPLGNPDGFLTRDDAAFPEGTFLSRPGAVGDLSLGTPLPMRFSNGEATTFVWPMNLTNRGSDALDVALALEAPGFIAALPASVHVAPGASSLFNVSVAVPFSHEHGTQRTFLLTAEASPTQRVRLQLGIDYPAIAQPSGHHSRLFLHVGQSTLLQTTAVPYGLWMNTLEEDGTVGAAIGSQGNGVCPRATPDATNFADWGMQWFVELQPALRMGLAARPQESASLDLELDARAALPAGDLHAQVFVAQSPVDEFELFQGNRTWGTVAVPATTGPERLGIHIDIPLSDDLAGVPPSNAHNLYLAILYCPELPGASSAALTVANQFASIVDAAAVNLVSGAQLLLPLDEYHDPVSTGTMDARPSGDAAQPATPGKASPAPGWAFGLVLLALVALTRRRQ